MPTSLFCRPAVLARLPQPLYDTFQATLAPAERSLRT
jgi:hypothetical protein